METSLNLTSKMPGTGTTIFSVMSALANEHGAVNLAQGFPDFSCPEELINRVDYHMRQGRNQYAPMPGVPELRKKISEKTLKCYGTEYDWQSEITVVGGATLALFCAISAVVKENDEVIIIEPAYDSYIPAITLNGGKPVFSKLKYPNYQIDWQEVKKLINFRTRAIMINSPHNPCGTVMSAEDMRQLERLTENTDIVVISDEVYEHILFDGLKHQSACMFPGLASRSFIVSSFGKTYHNTGWKMGYVLAPEKLTAEFRKIYQYVAFSTSTPVQYAYADFLDNDGHYLALSSFYQQKRDYFRDLVRESRFKILSCSGSYFQLLGYDKISKEHDYDFAVRLTKEEKIAGVPVSVFYHDKTDNRVLRFCFAKNEDTLKKAAEILCRL